MTRRNTLKSALALLAALFTGKAVAGITTTPAPTWRKIIVKRPDGTVDAFEVLSRPYQGVDNTDEPTPKMTV